MKKIIKKLWEKFKWTFIGMYTAHSADKKLARSKDYPPVYILQMGKVASTSIRNSLEEQYQGLVTHSHHFMKNKEYKHAKHRNKWRKNERVYDYYFSDEFNGLKIISLVREPIGRNVSAFFQTFSRNMGVNVHQKKFTMDELRSGYLENMKHEVPLIFFDHINEYFNIDVYSKPFPKHIGYITFDNGKGTEMLLMKHDLNDKIKEQLIAEFLGLDSFKLKNYNVSENKVYAKLYRDFKSNVSLPDTYLNEMAESKYFKHFYDNEVIKEVCDKWRNKA